MTERDCFVFDIDGTIADGSHRIHHLLERPKNWDAYFAKAGDDAPIVHMIEVVRCLSHFHTPIYVSGRREQCRNDTMAWFWRHDVPPGRLYMRPDGDCRDDDVLKLDLLAQVRAAGFRPIMWFDDRTRVVNALRDAGVPVAQAAPGDF